MDYFTILSEVEMKNKALKKEQFTAGSMVETMTRWGWNMGFHGDPLKFANSDNYRKISNRNKKRK